MTGSRDGHISEPGIEQLGMNAGIGVDENPFGSETLRAVTGHGVSVIEVPMGGGIEFHLTTTIEARGNVTVERNGLDHREITVCDAE